MKPEAQNHAFLRLSGLLLAATLVAQGCDTAERQVASDSRVVIDVWIHSGQTAERDTLEQQVQRFNTTQDGVKVKLTVLPEGTYNAQVQAAALAGELPDVLEFDGPFVYNYAWQGRLLALDDLLPAELRTDLLPSIIAQGTYAGRLYSVGTFDSGLGLWADRRRLDAAGVRVPQRIGEAWSADEFSRVLTRLAAGDPDGAVLDLKLNYSGEWYTYAFSPILQSAGADLIAREGEPHSGGILDSPAAVKALHRVQEWIQGGFVDPNLDDAAFVEGRVALSWVGHWEYPRYREALGEHLVLLPLPDFGRGTRTGQGSWNWGITTRTRDPVAAMRFLRFLLRPEEILAMTDANGAVPATRSAISRSKEYQRGGPLHLFVEQLESAAVPRPRTPAYPVITSAFQEAFNAIRNGGDVTEALQRAAAAIDRDLRDNQGYPVGKLEE